MVRIEIEYRDGLRTQALHLPSGALLVTDAPVDNCGRGESFSPTDLVATALGSCMLTIMGILADRHGWSLAGARVSVEKKMASEPRRIAELEVEIAVPGERDERQRTALERAALTCPVHRTLGDQVSMPVRFVWGAPAPE